MDPIYIRTDTTFAEALKCAQYRIPKPRGFKAPGYVLALGTRYGFIGLGAAHYLLATADARDEAAIVETIKLYPQMVEDHVRWELGEQLPFSKNSAIPHVVGRLASLPLEKYLQIYKNVFPLQVAAETIADQILESQRELIQEGWRCWQRRRAQRAFRNSLDESIKFSYYFYERRQADVEEVPEIVLLGE